MKSTALRLASAAVAIVCAHAFLPTSYTSTHQPITAGRCCHHTAPLLSQSDPSDGGESDLSDEEDEDLLDELAEQNCDEKLSILNPESDELKDAAKDAENAFLAAMLEQTPHFKRIKSDEGSDKAVEVFMGRIQEEDEAGRREAARGREGGESMDETSFVQEMGEESDGLGEGDNGGSGDAWQ